MQKLYNFGSPTSKSKLGFGRPSLFTLTCLRRYTRFPPIRACHTDDQSPGISCPLKCMCMHHSTHWCHYCNHGNRHKTQVKITYQELQLLSAPNERSTPALARRYVEVAPSPLPINGAKCLQACGLCQIQSLRLNKTLNDSSINPTAIQYKPNCSWPKIS